jgi:hypothetical protein
VTACGICPRFTGDLAETWWGTCPLDLAKTFFVETGPSWSVLLGGVVGEMLPNAAREVRADLPVARIGHFSGCLACDGVQICCPRYGACSCDDTCDDTWAESDPRTHRTAPSLAGQSIGVAVRVAVQVYLFHPCSTGVPPVSGVPGVLFRVAMSHCGATGVTFYFATLGCLWRYLRR